MATAKKRKRGKWECPTCGDICKTAAGLGGHRFHAHGTPGKSMASLYRRGEIGNDK